MFSSPVHKSESKGKDALEILENTWQEMGVIQVFSRQQRAEVHTWQEIECNLDVLQTTKS